jgi:hypothetical protein
MNKLLRSFLLILMLAGVANAQVPATGSLRSFRASEAGETKSNGATRQITQGPSAAPFTIDVPGANQLSLRNWYPTHTNGRALHNIQVDPSNPRRVHAVIMGDPAPAEDDTSADASWPGRRVYYMFTSDAGATWGAPVSVTPTRAGFPDLQLYKRGDEYMPIIALHRADQGTSDYRSAILIGTGAPGSGQFSEAAADRTHSTAGEQDIIWPTIAMSPNYDKVYMIASVIPDPSTAPRRRFQFTSFNLDAAAGTATWNGPWVNGPGDDDVSIEQGGGFVIRTSATGKIGVLWVPEDEGGQGVYFSESTDGGANWSEATLPIYDRIAALQPDGSETDPPSLMTPISGFDFFYDGETAQATWSAYASTPDNTYFPSLAAIMYWRSGMLDPQIIVSRTEFTTDLVIHQFQPDLGFFGGGISVSPQAANIQYSTIALTPHPKKWSVIYEAWVEGDTSQVYTYERGGEQSDSFVWSSLWQTTTTDGGLTWSEPVKIRGNDVENPDETKLDYRFPNVSLWNPPLDQTHINYQMMYAVDTLPGIWVAGGMPIWGDMAYYAERLPVEVGSLNAVKRTGTTENLTLEQNFPNPFNPSTSVAFSVKEAAQVRLVVEDMMGREVATMFEGVLGAGQKQEVMFDASTLTSGVYQYVLKSENESVARRMVLTK